MRLFGKNKHGKKLLIDVGKTTIKFLITEGKYPDTLKILDYRLVHISAKNTEASLEELQEIIKHTCQSLNFKSGTARTLIKPQQEVVRVVELPDIPVEELKKAAGYQLNRYVPFGRDEAIYDCYPIPGVSAVNGMIKCVLVAVRRTFVEQHCKLFEPSNIAPVVIDVEAVAIMNAYAAAGKVFNEKNEIPNDNQNIALVHLGASHTGLCVIRDNTPVASRSINIGAESVVNAVKEYLNVEPVIAIDKLSEEKNADDKVNDLIAEFVNSVCIELKASLAYCKREFDVDVKRIYLTGGASNNVKITQLLSDVINLSVHQFNPFRKIYLSGQVAANDDFQNNALSFVPLFALAVRESYEE